MALLDAIDAYLSVLWNNILLSIGPALLPYSSTGGLIAIVWLLGNVLLAGSKWGQLSATRASLARLLTAFAIISAFVFMTGFWFLAEVT